MAFYELKMSQHPAGVTNLPPGYEGFYTGLTGECVIVCVLWNYNAERGFFRGMRGIHLGGGTLVITNPGGNLVASALFAGVPDNATTTLVVTGCDLVRNRWEMGRVNEIHQKYFPKANFLMGATVDALIYKNGMVVRDTVTRRIFVPPDPKSPHLEYLTPNDVWVTKTVFDKGMASKKAAIAERMEGKGIAFAGRFDKKAAAVVRPLDSKGIPQAWAAPAPPPPPLRPATSPVTNIGGDGCCVVM